MATRRVPYIKTIMSLDVYLISDTPIIKPPSSGIFVRRDGQTVEITEEEWFELHPDREPVRFIHDNDEEEETDEVFHAKITHNLGKMANAAGIYEALWRPEEIQVTHAHQLLVPLAQGLLSLLENREKYEEYNPKNGWGNYDTLVAFVSNYLTACIQYPNATVKTDR